MPSPLDPERRTRSLRLTIHSPHWLARLPITLFSIVMGLTGLALAWRRVFPAYAFARPVASASGWLATTVFTILLGLYGWKLIRHSKEVRAEAVHPIAINFLPTLPISLLLLAVFWLPVPGLARGLWLTGAFLQLWATIYVINQWIHLRQFTLEHVNPAWFIPVVGNIVVPVAGVPIGQIEASWFFFSIGMLFWMVLLTFVMFRLIFQEPLPQRMMPTLFIMLAPPSVGFISYTGLIGSLDSLARILFYSALFLAVFLASNAIRFFRAPFFLTSWAYSFPFAAFTIATAKMGTLTGLVTLILLARLALTLLSLLVLWLIVSTWLLGVAPKTQDEN